MIERVFYKGVKRDCRAYVLEENMKRIKMFAGIIFVMEFFFLIGTFLLSDEFFSNDLMIYRIHYVVLLTGSLLMLIVVRMYNRNKSYHKKYVVLVYMCLLATLMWAASITSVDVNNGQNLMVYVTFVYLTSFALIIKPDIHMLVLLSVQLVLLLSIKNHDNFTALLINSSIFVIFAWFVGRYQYALISERYGKEKIIEEKNDKLEKQNLELVRLMMVDHLTGVYNRYSLDDILSKKWMESYIHRSPLTVLMIDIDDFKLFNDHYGHVLGDECLRKVGQLLKTITDQNEGYTFRYGGDEFCLVLSEVQKDIIIDEINMSVSRITLQVAEEKLHIHLSIGVYHDIPKEEEDMWRCIEQADIDLYNNKSKRKRRKTDRLTNH